MLKKFFIASLMIIGILSFVACSKTATVSEEVISIAEKGDAEAGNSQLISVLFNDREYNEIKVIEIPSFIGSSKEIDGMNKAVAAATDSFMMDISENEAIQITSHPVTTNNYLQVIVHYLSYQGEDSAGDVVTVNYNIKEDKYITLDDVLADGSKNRDSILEDVTMLHESNEGVGIVTSANIVGFFIRETFDEDSYDFYVKLNTKSPNGDTSTSLYRYLYNINQLELIDSQTIVDPLTVDKYEPELLANKIANELMNGEESTTIEDNTVTLIANFLNGHSEYSAELIKEHVVSYTGELTIDKLANELSLLTGLDFDINSATIEGDNAYVDWASSSTLLAGLDDREQKEEFFFFDVVSLNWFMLDSLNDSIINNFPVSTVFYTMDGGEALVVPEMPPYAIFDPLVPYLSSVFYYSHGMDLEEVDFTVTEGTWRLYGEEATAYFIMDGAGMVEAYYASGSPEYSAYLEQGYGGLSGYIHFNMFTQDGDPMNEMWFDGSEKFYLGDPINEIAFIKDLS